MRHVGLSEVGAATIRRAAAVTPISDLQIEYSLLQRDIEDEILPTCRELGVGITAYGVLSRGLIGGSGTLEGGRRITPRFADGNRQHNEALVARLAETAERQGCTVAQLALAWVAARGDDIVPVVGARRVEQVTTMLEPVTLTAEEATELAALIPRGAVAGDRYPAFAMADLDSERRTTAANPVGTREGRRQRSGGLAAVRLPARRGARRRGVELHQVPRRPRRPGPAPLRAPGAARTDRRRPRRAALAGLVLRP